MQDFEEFQIRIGEGTEFAATLTATPDNDNCDGTIWMGRITFDDNAYNWPHQLPNYDGTMTTLYEDWEYPATKSGGTFLMNLLEKWHGEIVLFIGRMRAKS